MLYIEKDDLVRSAAPGYIFIAFLTAFALITKEAGELTRGAGLLALVAGFPLGLIFQNVYRILIHVGSGEQEEMFVRDRDLIAKATGAHLQPTEQFSDRFWLNPRDSSLFFTLFLNKADQAEMRQRLLFLVGQVHFLGSSIVALASAMFFISIFLIFNIVQVVQPELFWLLFVAAFFVMTVFAKARERALTASTTTSEFIIYLVGEDLAREIRKAGLLSSKVPTDTDR